MSNFDDAMRELQAKKDAHEKARKAYDDAQKLKARALLIKSEAFAVFANEGIELIHSILQADVDAIDKTTGTASLYDFISDEEFKVILYFSLRDRDDEDSVPVFEVEILVNDDKNVTVSQTWKGSHDDVKNKASFGKLQKFKFDKDTIENMLNSHMKNVFFYAGEF